MAWKRYKSLIVSTLVLFVFFWLVGLLHDDYVNYIELNDDKQHIGLSFVIKWLVFILGVVVYVLFNTRKTGDSTKSIASSNTASEQAEAEQDKPCDPFSAIRQRDKLRTRADFIIEKHKK